LEYLGFAVGKKDGTHPDKGGTTAAFLSCRGKTDAAILRDLAHEAGVRRGGLAHHAVTVGKC